MLTQCIISNKRNGEVKNISNDLHSSVTSIHKNRKKKIFKGAPVRRNNNRQITIDKVPCLLSCHIRYD